MAPIEFPTFDAFIRGHASCLPRTNCTERRALSEWDFRPLYRGLPSSQWPLTTTLERASPGCGTLWDYMTVMRNLYSELRSHSGELLRHAHHIKPEKTWDEVCNNREFLELAVRLRHFGFPSPLLDWTRSPYIAAFFAFATPTEDGHVAIHAYVERIGRGKAGWLQSPRIETIGPNLVTHPRHHIQQAEYSLCLRRDGDIDKLESHLSVGENPKQDIRVKFVLPARERVAVLRSLQSMNINRFTLFGDEAALYAYLADKYLSNGL